jgi:lipopolysaccharide export system protein LptC
MDVVGTLTAPAPLDAGPPPAKPVWPRLPWHQRLLQTLTAYLPLVVMALLALLTWWLVKNSPTLSEPRAKKPVRHEPDYIMEVFTLQRYSADGALAVQIQGAQLRHFPDTDMLEIDDIQLVATAADGAVTRATAKQATAKGDGTEVQLTGGARVVQEGSDVAAPMEVQGEFLHAFLKTKQLRSHLPVRVRQGANELRVAALQVDHVKQVAVLNGPIRMQIDPPKPVKR